MKLKQIRPGRKEINGGCAENNVLLMSKETTNNFEHLYFK